MTTFAAILVAIISLGGSIFAVYQNRRTEDKKTDITEFNAISQVLLQSNSELRQENRELRERLREAERRISELERGGHS